MAEVVFGSLGLVGLLSLFQTCNTAYDVFVRSARNLGKDYYRISVLLGVERQRLRLWGQYLGISPSQQCRLLRAESLETQQTVVILLESIKALLDDIGVIMVRYDVKIVEASQDIINTNTDISLQGLNLEDLRNCPAVKMAEVKRTMTERSVASSTSRLGKIRWALSDSAKLMKLAQDLRLINEDLWVSLPVNRWLALAKGLPSVVLPEIHDQAMLKEVEFNAKDSRTTKLLAACSDLRRAAIASANDASSSFGEDLRWQPDCMKDSIALSSGDPKLASDRRLASVRGADGITRSVILEWRHVDRSFNFEEKQMIRSRIKALAVLLSSPKSSEFGLLKCIGFFKDDQTAAEKYGLLFEAPDIQAIQAIPGPALPSLQLRRPCSLYEYISITKEDPPLLGDRFRVASALCNILLQIHASNWLHKAIRSSNILFLPLNPEVAQPVLDMTKPFLVGFDFSRPDRPSAESLELPRDQVDNAYRHPALWPLQTARPKPRFRKEFDIFALGVVLLEIGNWRLVGQYCTPHDLASPQAWKDFLLRCTKPLGYRCGRIYQEIVVTCLTGPFAENYATGIDDLDPALDTLDIKRSFLFDVVYQLAKCYA